MSSVSTILSHQILVDDAHAKQLDQVRSHCRKRVRTLQAQIERLRDECESRLDRARSKLRDQSSSLGAEVSSLQQQLHNTTQRLSDTQHSLDSANTEKQSLLSKNAQLQARTIYLCEAIQKQKRIVHGARAETSRLSSDLHDMKAKLRSADVSLRNAQQQNTSLKDTHAQHIAALKDEIARHKEHIARAQVNDARRTDQIAELDRRLADAESSRGEAESDAAAVRIELSSTREQLSRSTSQYEAAQEALVDVRQQLADSQAALQRASAERDAAKIAQSALQGQVGALQDRIQSIEQTGKQLQEDKLQLSRVEVQLRDEQRKLTESWTSERASLEAAVRDGKQLAQQHERRAEQFSQHITEIRSRSAQARWRSIVTRMLAQNQDSVDRMVSLHLACKARKWRHDALSYQQQVDDLQMSLNESLAQVEASASAVVAAEGNIASLTAELASTNDRYAKIQQSPSSAPQSDVEDSIRPPLDSQPPDVQEDTQSLDGDIVAFENRLEEIQRQQWQKQAVAILQIPQHEPEDPLPMDKFQVNPFATLSSDTPHTPKSPFSQRSSTRRDKKPRPKRISTSAAPAQAPLDAPPPLSPPLSARSSICSLPASPAKRQRTSAASSQSVPPSPCRPVSVVKSTSEMELGEKLLPVLQEYRSSLTMDLAKRLNSLLLSASASSSPVSPDSDAHMDFEQETARLKHGMQSIASRIERQKRAAVCL